MFFFGLDWLLWAIIINGLMAGWVYSDSKDRGDRDPGGWVAVILVFGIFGLIYYLFKRPSRPLATAAIQAQGPAQNFCNQCRIWSPGNYCTRCGQDLRVVKG